MQCWGEWETELACHQIRGKAWLEKDLTPHKTMDCRQKLTSDMDQLQPSYRFGTVQGHVFEPHSALSQKAGSWGVIDSIRLPASRLSGPAKRPCVSLQKGKHQSRKELGNFLRWSCLQTLVHGTRMAVDKLHDRAQLLLLLIALLKVSCELASALSFEACLWGDLLPRSREL